MTEIAGTEGDGVVTVYYPSSSDAQTVKHGLFSFQLVWHGAPRRGNGRLIVIFPRLRRGALGACRPGARASSNMASWSHAQAPAVTTTKTTARRDPRLATPAWRGVARDRRGGTGSGGSDRCSPLDKVGMYGFSAGGHTALDLAGGRWSPARFRLHCVSLTSPRISRPASDLATGLNGNLLDGLKTTIALWVIRWPLQGRRVANRIPIHASPQSSLAARTLRTSTWPRWPSPGAAGAW